MEPKKVGLYTPYPDTLGGGERYLMTIAECLSHSGFQVEVFWDDSSLKQKLADRFCLSLEKVTFVPNIFNSKFNLFQKKKFDE